MNIVSFRRGLSAVFALVFLGLECSAQASRDSLPAAVTGVLINPAASSTPQLLAALEAEQAMLAKAARTAAGGDLATAWAMIIADARSDGAKTGPGVSVERLGWRVATVTGFLKNQSKFAAADQFARFALGEPWCRQAPSDEVRYWCAWVAIEGASDRGQALQWLGQSRSGERAAAGKLRDKLNAEEKSFPGRG